MNIHHKNILVTLLLLSFVIFDSSVILLVSTVYLGLKYKQLSMFIKSWLLLIYINYGFIGLLSQFVGCGILFFVIYREKCMSYFNNVNDYLGLDKMFNNYYDIIRMYIFDLVQKFDNKFNLDPKLELVDSYLSVIYTRIYNFIYHISPFVALKLKSWFDNVGNMIKTEDYYLEAPKQSKLDYILSYLKTRESSSGMEEIDKLVADISSMSDALLGK